MSQRSFRRARARRVERERRRLTNAKRRAMVAGATVGATMIFAASAEATTYTVTTNGDPVGTSCVGTSCPTLRDAISAANANPTTGGDTITFASDVTGTIDIHVNGTLNLSDTDGLTIQGPRAGTLAISGYNSVQVFNATDPATISGLTIEYGSSGGNAGGAIYADSTLSLTDDTIKDSTTSNDGGGVFSRADTTITGCTITGNTAAAGGGIAGGGIDDNKTLTIASSQITDNHATSSAESLGGGGIFAEGNAFSLTASTVTGNSSPGGAGGGVALNTKYGTTITGSTISVNSSATGGGGLAITDTTDGNPVNNPVSIQTSTVSGNQAPEGAGVEIGSDVAGTPITIGSSTISGNTGGTSSFGGGLLFTGGISDPVDVVDSTIYGNSATDGGGVSLGNSGSALIASGSTGSIGFDNSTVAANTATTNGGGIYLDPYMGTNGTASIDSTIVAGNTAASVGQDLAQASGATGGFDTAFDLVQQPGTASLLTRQSDIFGQDPQLGSLANNGGPTQTMLPASTSPVIDQGHAKSGLTADQRGDPRTVVQPGVAEPPGGDGTDIGSVELPLPAGTSPPVTGPAGTGAQTAPPIVLAGGAPTVTDPTSGGFTATVNPEGLATDVYFEYGPVLPDTPFSYDSQTPSQAVGSDFSGHVVTATVTGLLPNTQYHFRAVATNSAGTTTGPDQILTTPAQAPPAPPVLGKSVDVEPVSGLVLVKLPGGASPYLADPLTAALSKGQGFVPLTEARSIPTGSEVDALAGSLKIISNNGKVGKTQTATLTGGLFKLTQARTGITKGLTNFNLVEGAFRGAPTYATCKAHKAGDQATTASLSTKTLQLLKVSGHGKFKTTGRYSSATVRGTIYTVADRCDGTLTRVIRDTVLVDDFVRHKTILLHSGQSYLAKKP